MNQANYEMRLSIVENALKHGVTTRQELRIKLGCDDRTVRELISTIAQKQPVVAVSSKKGYFILPPRKGLTQAWLAYYDSCRKHAIAENTSRASEIVKRNVPLERW